MFKVNEYFDGKVKSISFKTFQGLATIGVMAPGEYEFATSSREVMTVITGALEVKLPGKSEWEIFGLQKTFTVDAGRKFHLKVKEDTSYLCLYQ
ncbi:MAG: pyrimidine/purine nucleoside phosphorylase [Acidobacteriota bacterium]